MNLRKPERSITLVLLWEHRVIGVFLPNLKHMRNPFRFFVELMQQPISIPIWVVSQMVINLASLGFWHEPLAKVIFITFMVSAILMMGLYSRFGFEKILGLGQILWIPLLVYVLVQIPAAEVSFKRYLLVLSVSITISLVFDIIDVWKYFINRKNASYI